MAHGLQRNEVVTQLLHVTCTSESTVCVASTRASFQFSEVQWAPQNLCMSCIVSSLFNFIFIISYQFNLRGTILDCCDCLVMFLVSLFSTTCWVFRWHRDSPFNATYCILYQSHVQLAVKCMQWLWKHQMSRIWPPIALSSVNLLAKSQHCSAAATLWSRFALACQMMQRLVWWNVHCK